MTPEEIAKITPDSFYMVNDYAIKALDLSNESPLIKAGAIISEKIKESPMIEISNSSLGTPWSVTSELITPKPTVEEELSKIHEELACVNKSLNEMRHESIKKDDIIEKQQKENKKLKAKLRKEKAKNKSNNNKMQVEIDNLQCRMKQKMYSTSKRVEYEIQGFSKN